MIYRPGILTGMKTSRAAAALVPIAALALAGCAGMDETSASDACTSEAHNEMRHGLGSWHDAIVDNYDAVSVTAEASPGDEDWYNVTGETVVTFVDDVTQTYTWTCVAMVMDGSEYIVFKDAKGVG